MVVRLILRARFRRSRPIGRSRLGRPVCGLRRRGPARGFRLGRSCAAGGRDGSDCGRCCDAGGRYGGPTEDAAGQRRPVRAFRLWPVLRRGRRTIRFRLRTRLRRSWPVRALKLRALLRRRGLINRRGLPRPVGLHRLISRRGAVRLYGLISRRGPVDLRVSGPSQCPGRLWRRGPGDYRCIHHTLRRTSHEGAALGTRHDGLRARDWRRLCRHLRRSDRARRNEHGYARYRPRLSEIRARNSGHCAGHVLIDVTHVGDVDCDIDVVMLVTFVTLTRFT